ncbi:MAG: molybdopterin oxidoreductase [Planctomycetota bacterium]|nr:MAG: molybdopterin oxidoreductase [Planctomycetota bacterium]
MKPLPVIEAGGSQTAVERFAATHDRGLARDTDTYVALMPASPPGPGQQYAFEVDLDACSGCKACVVACHNRNGLDEGELWRQVGLLLGEDAGRPYLQHVTAACHHCVEPACMDGCPVDAYQKDPHTGIVRHLDEVCIGCQYCTLTCPYEVPQYNSRRGIVRKCDMCSDRLTAGEPPACAAACPQQAIRIRVVDEAEAVQAAETGSFLPTAPDPRVTIPTTVYTSRRPFPRTVRAADHDQPRMQHAHWSLIVMLVLTQLSVGTFWIQAAVEAGWLHAAVGTIPDAVGTDGKGDVTAVSTLSRTFAWLCGGVALTASVFHLGRPWRAYRALRGLGHSWLSREILAFGVFAVCATFYAVAPGAGLGIPRWLLRGTTLVSGLAGVCCSILIYHRAGRPLWHWTHATWRFVGTMVVLGLAANVLLAVSNADRSADLRTVPGIARMLIVVTLLKLAGELAPLRHVRGRRPVELKQTARLLVGPLLRVLWARIALGFLGGVWFPLLLLSTRSAESFRTDQPIAVLCGGAAFACALLGEGIERYLFFCAAAGRRMPGLLQTASSFGHRGK